MTSFRVDPCFCFRMSPGARMTSSFLNVEVNGTRRALLTGGWNGYALNDVATFEQETYHWNFFSPDPLPFPIRSSVPIERNRTPFLLGGLLCSSNGGSCNQTDKGEEKYFGTRHQLVECYISPKIEFTKCW